ncbi:putative nucleoporin Nsp1 [Aspergillus clavatus NRRL 1]|uniref:Nucleoporin NSP1 n=1 Tax=Aspergillus clavatus (strain ATCC 1007 / CBS 513.65 / DSM 816 / NCTC 3887 / NRRL 1 / QM 1276 / 107) TaxID=344612 RepID=A1CEX4_ASPCL|nr:nucleoporin Nsp1, putative [Aspergillus clavatus NRRL 1]EAW11423.1 nucleoporin Nsp1, putative [Aspergillus clavatus NRRL 1]
MSKGFSFGAPASNGASGGGLFGSAGNAFGSNQNNPSTGSGGGLFGNVGASTSGTSSPSIFGASPATGSGNTLFGGAAGGASSGAASGGTPAFSFANQSKPGSTPQSPALFGGGSQTPNKPGETPAAGQTSSGNLFGNAAKPTGNLFGGAAATPAPPGNSLFNTNSTTPAGPPPQGTAAGQGQSLFGQTAQKPGGIFGGLNTATTSSSIASPTTTTTTGSPATTTPTLFGGNTQPQSTGGGMFGGNAQQKPAFGATPSAPSGGLFGAAKDKPAESTTPTTTTEGAAKPLFGAAPAAGQAQGSSLFKMPSAGTDTASKPAFPSLGMTTTASTTQPATTSTTSATPQKPAFPTLGGTTSATPSGTPAAAPTGGGLFGGLNASKPAETAPSTQAPSTSTGAAATISGAKPSLTATSAPATSATTTTATTGMAAPTTTAAGGTALGASTAGPTPPAQSRLKNKTMDEIITRWATDLTKYQKEFREQAEQVAEWDRMLVENITKVQKLYGSTVDADRATQEIERQLASVEGQQEELSSWLDRYEREVDEMMSKQVGPGEALQGPDQERERTYKLAEKLSDQLDDMGKDLTSMIEEVNSASATLSKTNKADEPISQIVRILNSHLSQLQLIDQGTSELQSKVSAAQKSGHALSSRFGHGFGSSGMGGGSAADDFYRSYMGRR